MIDFKVQGMTCGGCARGVTSALQRVDAKAAGEPAAALVQERCFLNLESPVTRVTGYDVPFPYTLEGSYLPTVERVMEAVQASVNY